MRKTVLYIAMSLDGYVADNKGGVEWLHGDGSEPESMGTYFDFYETIDTIVMGYNTYHQITTELSPDKWVYEGKRCFVTTSREIEPHDDIIFTAEDPTILVEKLRAEEGKDIWICGGAAVAQALIAGDMIDEYRISIIPVLLGDGIPLFAETRKELKLRSSSQSNGITELYYTHR